MPATPEERRARRAARRAARKMTAAGRASIPAAVPTTAQPVDINADYWAWRREHPDGRDRAGWWSRCPQCKALVWAAWLESQRRSRYMDGRDGQPHAHQPGQLERAPVEELA